MTPPTGFDRDVWEGRKRIAAPVSEQTSVLTGEPLHPPITDIAIGWECWHRTDEWTDGTKRGGVVIDVRRDEQARPLVVVAEAKPHAPGDRGRRWLIHTWPLSVLDPESTRPLPWSQQERYAIEFCKSIGANVRGWFAWKDKLLDAAVELTKPGRDARTAATYEAMGE